MLINATSAKRRSTLNRAVSDSSKERYALISVHGNPAAQIGQDGAGGQNVYVRSLGFALAERGCQVDMFTRREHPDQPGIVEHAPGCRTISLTAGPVEFIHRDQLFEYLPAFVDAWITFQQESGYEYKLIHTNYWLSGWVGLQLRSRLGLPQVHTYHSIGIVKYQATGDLPDIALTRLATERACLEQTNCVIATSPQEAEDLRQLVSEQGRIEIIPCGIDTQHFAKSNRVTARRLLGIDAETNLVLYVGRFDPRKGIETLIEAFSQLPPNTHLQLVGGNRENGSDHSEQQRLTTLVNQLRLSHRTTFAGQIPQEYLPTYYAAADVCVVPSYYEPFGLVALEAMAAGTPVVASNVGGLQYSVEHGKTGLLVPPRDPHALAVAIESILVDRSWSHTLGEAGWKRVQSQFSYTGVARRIYQLYQSLVRSDLNNLIS